MYTLRILEKSRNSTVEAFDYVTENFEIGTSYTLLRSDSGKFERIMKDRYPNLKEEKRKDIRAILCCGNGDSFFIERENELRCYSYYIMTESGNTFEKL